MRMKGFGWWWWLLFLIGTAGFLHLGFSSNGGIGSRRSMTLMMERRKLKEKVDSGGGVGLEDYRPIDPVPSCTTSIKPGPIQHGSPLLPYIPEPSPSPPPEHAILNR